MRWLLIFLFPLTLYSQQEINLRQFTIMIPDTAIYGDTCNMSMHGYFSCNDRTAYYLEIKNDTLYYYQTMRLGNINYQYRYVSVETCPLASIDTAASYVWFDKYSNKGRWDVVIELKRPTKRKNKIWNRVYWNDGKSNRSTQWRTSIICWDTALFDKIKLAVKNLGTKE